MEEQILDVLRRVFKDASIDETCSQKNCKAWDSLYHLNLIVELEIECGISFEPEEIAQMTDYESICKTIQSKRLC